MPIFTAKIPTQNGAGIPLCIEIYGDVFPSVNSLFCIYAIHIFLRIFYRQYERSYQELIFALINRIRCVNYTDCFFKL